jgi:glycosyltransferase involved in cell wall biosynthesis
MPHLSITSMQDRDFLKRVISIIDPTATSLRVLMRKGNVLLGISNEKNAAERTLGLYQPQRLVARSIVSFLRVLSRFGLHGLMLQKMPMAAKSMDLHPPLCGIVPGSAGILVGSPEHKVRRAIVSYRNGAEWEVAKISFGDEGAKILEKEAATLNQLQSKATGAPRLLGLHHGDGVTVLRMPYLKGKAIKSGETSDALNLLKSWVGSNDPLPIQRFSEWSHIETAIKSMRYGEKALEALSKKSLRPVICHGDFARWNLLKQTDGSLMVLDWEWGNTHGMPGLDLVHYFAQDARLVRQLDSANALRVVEASLSLPKAKAYLAQTGWTGNPITPILAWAAFKHGARHQKIADFLAESLKVYLERQRSFKYKVASVNTPVQVAPSSDITSSLPPTAKTNRRKTGASIRISVVTPSYKQIDFLKCCAASVADQAGDFEVEHLIHDGGSGREFEQWAAEQQGAVCVPEKDDGMYDAINRGFRKANGEIIAWLNCDEQYLPGALDKVSRFFDSHPDIDIVFGDVVLVDELMTPLAYRRAIKPSIAHIRYSHLSTFSAATFIRRRALDEGHFLQTRWKTIADAVWIEEMLSAGYRSATIREPLAVFCMVGSNLGQSSLLFEERKQWELELKATNKWIKRLHIMRHRIAKFLFGAYNLQKTRISAFLPNTSSRTTKNAWLNGQWSFARHKAQKLRVKREEKIGMLKIHKLASRWSFLQALCVIILAFFVDKIQAGDAVKGPAILIISLLYLSFRAKMRDLTLIAILYSVIAFYLLSERPTDVLVARMITFFLGACLAVLFSIAHSNLSEWMGSTVSLVRKIPFPILLTDRTGMVILVNNSALKLWQITEEDCLEHFVTVQLIEDGKASTKPTLIDSWAERPPDGLVSMSIKGKPEIQQMTGKVLVTGGGRRRFYVFMLSQ